jgi:hypothetical protein
MAIQPSDLGEEFIRSGKRLITQRSADQLLVRAGTSLYSTKENTQQMPGSQSMPDTQQLS